MQFLIRLLITACALMFVAHIVPGISVSGLYPAIIASLILGIVNAVVRPILILITLPITILTLGIFVFIINASLFIFVASFIDGFTVSSFFSGLIGSILMSIISGVVNKVVD